MYKINRLNLVTCSLRVNTLNRHIGINGRSITSASSDFTLKLDTIQDVDINRKLCSTPEAQLITNQLSCKRLFQFINFIDEYEDSKIDHYGELRILINTNAAVQRWSKKINIEFATYSEAPSWLIEDLSLQDSWNREYRNILIEFKKRKLRFKHEREDLQRTIERKLEEIDRKENEYDENCFRDNPVLLINKISTQSLPYNIVEKHVALNSKERKKALRMELDDYKRGLYKRFINKDINYDELYEIVK